MKWQCQLFCQKPASKHSCFSSRSHWNSVTMKLLHSVALIRFAHLMIVISETTIHSKTHGTEDRRKRASSVRSWVLLNELDLNGPTFLQEIALYANYDIARHFAASLKGPVMRLGRNNVTAHRQPNGRACCSLGNGFIRSQDHDVISYCIHAIHTLKAACCTQPPPLCPFMLSLTQTSQADLVLNKH